MDEDWYTFRNIDLDKSQAENSDDDNNVFVLADSRRFWEWSLRADRLQWYTN
jgi:hypothetical protein